MVIKLVSIVLFFIHRSLALAVAATDVASLARRDRCRDRHSPLLSLGAGASSHLSAAGKLCKVEVGLGSAMHNKFAN